MAALFEPFVWLLGVAVDLYLTMVVVQVALQWLIHFKVFEIKNEYSRMIMDFLARATNPVYNKIKAKVPAVSGFDISPLILVVALLFLSRFLTRLDIMLLS